MPTPNGYDDFLRAAELVHRWLEVPKFREVYFRDWSQASQQDLQILVSQNSEALASFQTGRSRPCRVAVQVSKDYQATNHKNRSRLRLLTSFLLARARLAEIEGRTNDAFRVYLETYRFTHEIGRGGLALDFLMQIVCEHIVLKSFSSFFPSLSSSQCAETLRLIDDMEADQEELQVLLRRDRRWLHATYDFSTRVKARMSLWREAAREVWRTHSLVALNDSSSTRELLAQAQQRHQKEIADVRQQLRRQLSGDRIKALP